MGDNRQRSYQSVLGFMEGGEGDPRYPLHGGPESPKTASEPESPASTQRLMEEICSRENMKEALKRVQSNGGSPGIDNMEVSELPKFFAKHWPALRDQLLSGTYKPKPVKRVEIPKRAGGVRQLGIPTAVDRVIQQAILQVLQPRWDPTFSEQSFGFRPGRSAHQAVAKARQYQAEGYRYVVDIDLEKFFDRVNHDILMSRVARRISDKRLLKLLRAFLTAGVLANGLVSPATEGTPQGGPLSPLLSNLLLDELDRELERRGLRFVRYADDCNIYVRSLRAGYRVMESLTRFVTHKLKLRVNRAKSAVDRPSRRKFLGFSFTREKQPRLRIAPESLRQFKKRIRELTRRSRGISLDQVIETLRPYLLGWRGYFGRCETPSVLKDLDKWIRRRLRAYLWQQWRRGKNRYAQLRRLGVSEEKAPRYAGSSKGPWRMSRNQGIHIALPNAYFTQRDLPSLAAT